MLEAAWIMLSLHAVFGHTNHFSSNDWLDIHLQKAYAAFFGRGTKTSPWACCKALVHAQVSFIDNPRYRNMLDPHPDSILTIVLYVRAYILLVF